MSQIHVEASAVIDARPEDVYAVISDYKVGHPAILPKEFTKLTVEKGGTGAGTVIYVGMQVMGVKQDYRLVVSEPEPGRMLVETDTEKGVTTYFKFEPLAGGKQTKFSIASDMRVSPGFAGFMEKLMTPPITRRIYKQELQNVSEYMRTRK
jgi:hypothetical protein